jgi:membrane dipeptidase
MVGLTWSFSNRFAGSSGDSGGGLTAEGRALVAQLAADGVIVDLSHASRATTLEVCGASAVPVIASHSDSHSVTAHARNLTDEEIRCIAATGGVVGVNFHATFVGGSRDVEAVADHADAIARIGGFGAVALGSDFDGLIKVPAGLEDASRLPALWAELRARGWTEAQIRGMRGENFLRVWEAVEHAATKADP